MIVEAKVTINASRAAVWNAISNIENAAQFIGGIEKIEVVEKPANGLVGLKWLETRMYFGKPATVEIWIADAWNEFYKTRTESDGFVCLSTMSISESSSGITLTTSHDYKPLKYRGKIKVTSNVSVQGYDEKDISARPERY